MNSNAIDLTPRRLTRNISSRVLQELCPLVLARQYDSPIVNGNGERVESWRNVPFWLEYSQNDFPTEDEIKSGGLPSKNQTADAYDMLPDINIELADGTKYISKQAICERIPDGRIGVIPLKSGCLWTMLPSDISDL